MVIKLSKKDRSILYQLNINSRQHAAKLAKELKLSKQSVVYRIKNLTDKRIVTQFYTLVNFTALGYKPYKIFLRMNNLNREQIQKFLEGLRKKEYVVWTVHCDGHFDVIIGLIAKNSEHFRGIYLDILDENQEAIISSDHSTIISAHQKKKEYLADKAEKPILNNFYANQPIEKIDKKDSQILSLLAFNSRLSIIDISRKISLTPEGTRIRIKNLEKRNIIMGSSILLDFNKIGFGGYKVLLKLRNKSQEGIKKLISFLLSYPKVLEVINVLGNWDIEFDLEVESINEFNSTITEIRNRFKNLILDCETLIKYEEHSYNYYPIKI